MHRKILRLIEFFIVSFAFILISTIAYPILFLVNKSNRHRLRASAIQAFARIVLKIFHTKVTAINFRPSYLDHNFLLASNHLSYLDIVIIASVIPSSFIARKDIRNWPVFGLLAIMGGTFFIDRNKVVSNVRAVFQVCKRLRERGSVLVFPESTTGNGREVLPIKPLFFASAIRSETPILPITITPRKINGHDFDDKTLDIFCWHGDMNFLPHLWEMLGVKSCEVSLVFNNIIPTKRFQRAKEITNMWAYLSTKK